jgi:hypothetical protein
MSRPLNHFRSGLRDGLTFGCFPDPCEIFEPDDENRSETAWHLGFYLGFSILIFAGSYLIHKGLGNL